MRKLVVQNLSAGLYYDLDEEKLEIVLIRGDQNACPGPVTRMEFGGFTAFNSDEIRKKVEGLKSPADSFEDDMDDAEDLYRKAGY